MKPTLYIIRGLPGSGKSTLADKIVENLLADELGRYPAIKVEADQFFVSSNGHVETYNFDRRFLGAKDFAGQCRARGTGGAILFVGAPEQALGADQAAAAGALGNLTKTLGVEWARDGIRVNSVLTRDAGATLGNLAAYLVSDYAAYVTGAVMGIDLDD